MSDWYDTREGIQEAVKKGLAGLHELYKARHEAGYTRHERLKEWCVLGLFHTDSCGNFGPITEGAPRDRIREMEIPDVMTGEEMKKFSNRWAVEHTGGVFPPVVETCNRCLRGWDLRNIRDYYTYRDRETEKWVHRHRTCQELAIIEQEQELFRDIVTKAEIPHSSMRAIPNEYYSSDPTWFGPWFIVETDLGPLRIGYRKRVINIDWTDTQVNHNGDILFEDENVTTWRTGVHAWGRDKAIEYLRKLFQ